MRHYLLAIDQGTTSSRAVLFNQNAQALFQAQHEFTQYYPHPGEVEHDAEEIWQTTLQCCREVLQTAQIGAAEVLAIGITNQRETTVLWDRRTGKPLHHAIVWQDRRTADICQQLQQDPRARAIPAKTGLLLDPYLSASKIRWLLDHCPQGQQRAERGELAFGTIECFLLWRLTQGKVHATDATNASRTLLFNIHQQRWDDDLLALFNIPRALLPEVYDNCHDYGLTEPSLLGAAIPITAMIGDQQAALVGQAAFQPGLVKCTYGTGGFCLVNTGSNAVQSTHHLLTTIAYRLNGKVTYGLEGSIFNAGTSIKWLRDNLGIITQSKQADELACSVPDTQGVIFVPAFTGLGAPYWDPQARGALLGLTRDTQKAHIARAALEAVAYQTLDLLNAMYSDGVPTIRALRVDGGMAASDWLLQFLADLLDCTIQRPHYLETTALGAAYLAGLGAGCFDSLAQLEGFWQSSQHFTPQIDSAQRQAQYSAWKHAVKRVLT